MLRRGYSTSSPIWESLFFGRGRRRFSDLIRIALDISSILSKLNAGSRILRDGGLVQRYMFVPQMGTPCNTLKKMFGKAFCALIKALYDCLGYFT